MLGNIKNRIDTEIAGYFRRLEREFSLSKASDVLIKNIKDFSLRKGKRIRPLLFVAGYLGFGGKACLNLYRSAVAFELLHDFLLVHDDIIDKSSTRRGRPSMHELFNKFLKGRKDAKFNGQDLSIATGDVMHALSMLALLSIKAEPKRKEEALRKFCEAAMYTGIGEAVELLCGLKKIEQISKNDIYRIYDLKTACYTFAYPLSIGALLAGANRKETKNLFKYGVYLGRAFQIKDDILGTFKEQAQTGKSSLTDLQEAKKTLLIWYACHNSSAKNKSAIKRILSKRKVVKADLSRMRRLVTESGALDYAEKEIRSFIKKAQGLNAASGMRKEYKNMLFSYSQRILEL